MLAPTLPQPRSWPAPAPLPAQPRSPPDPSLALLPPCPQPRYQPSPAPDPAPRSQPSFAPRSQIPAPGLYPRLHKRISVEACIQVEEFERLCEKGKVESALDILVKMDDEGIVPSVAMYRLLLKACSKRKALAQAKRVHAHLTQHGLEFTKVLGESVVSTFVKCGGLQDAVALFRSLAYRSASSWTTMISAYTMSGQGHEALRMYKSMREGGVQPGKYTFISLLKACGSIADLEEGKRIHAEAMEFGCGSDLFVSTSLVDMYGKCGSIVDAQKVFDGLSQRDVVSWNAMLTAYVQQGQADKALQMYDQMCAEGVNANDRTFVSALQACGMLAEKEDIMVDGPSGKVKSALQKGQEIHAHAKKQGYASDVFVGSSLVTMYRKCGSIHAAQDSFDVLSQRDVVTWNAMLAAYAQEDQAERAMQLYEKFCEDGVSPDSRTLVSALQACSILARKEPDAIVDGQSTKLKWLVKGQAIHANATKKGYDSDVLVGNSLVIMYGNCRSIEDARRVFDGLSQRNGMSWNAMLTVYVEQGQADQALQLYRQMQEERVTSDFRTFVSALQACCMLADKGVAVIMDGLATKAEVLEVGMGVHADAWRAGCDSHIAVGNTLISMYGKCGSVLGVESVFNALFRHNVVSWNARIGAYVEQVEAEKALQLYEQMEEQGMSPDCRTFVATLQACGMLAEKEAAVMVDNRFTKMNSLSVLKALHAHALHKGFNCDVFVANTLISAYGKCGNTGDAQNVFHGLSQPDVVSWNALLAAYVEQGQAEQALELFIQMQQDGSYSDVRTFVTAIQACGMVADKEVDMLVDGQSTKVKSLQVGKAIHANARRKGYESNVFVVTTLVTMYGKCKSMADAHNVFDALSQRNVVLWTSMLAVCVDQGEAEEAVQLYERMQQEGVSPNSRTFVSAFQACGMLAENQEDGVAFSRSTKVNSLKRARALHADAQQKGYDRDVFVGNALITMYGKCGSVEDSEHMFKGMLHKTVVSWNAMLAAYVEQGQADKALQLYEQMMVPGGISPDSRTFVPALQACGMLAEESDDMVHGQSIKEQALKLGKKIHADAHRKGHDLDSFVGNTLVSMYGKCGCIDDAQVVFDGLSRRDVVSWNAMLTAYVEQAQADDVLKLYRRMQQEGVSPDVRTFVSAIQACAILTEHEADVLVDGQPTKVNSLEVGRALHADAQNKGYESNVFVGSILISLYGKCGSIVDAQAVFNGMLQRDLACWNAMLTAYVEQGQAEKALQLYMRMKEEGLSFDEITLVCILQACSKTGNLRNLRRIHSSLVTTANTSSSFLSSALISAYGRCASMVDAQSVFNALLQPDRVSWNALIAAYAREGNCAASVQNYEDMLLAGIKPDGVTFLSLISACSHAGLVEKGVEYLESMSKEHGIPPDIEHYVSMVDLLGRAGFFSRVEDLLSTMPMRPNLTTWMCLLGACRKHGKLEQGRRAFNRAVELQPKHTAAYVLMSNMYADAGRWDLAKEIYELEQKALAWSKPPGQSWIQHERDVHSFLVGDGDCNKGQQAELRSLLARVSAELEGQFNLS